MDQYLKKLDEDGYVIIPDVLSEEKCKYYIKQFWDWLEGLNTGIDRNDKSTWRLRPNGGWPVTIHGLIQHYKIGHAQFIWDIRTEEAVINIFKKIWDDDDLLVSFDGACIMKPPNMGGSAFSKSWLHVDQGPRKKGKHCVQASVNLEESTINDGSFIAVPGSHKIHEKIFEKNGKDFSSDWYKLKEDDLEYIDSLGLKTKRLVVPMGSVILWDNRTIHCNCAPTKEGKNFRYTIFICMTPKKLCNTKNLEKRLNAFEDMRMTAHWPHHVKLFSKAPGTYGKEQCDFKLQTKLPELSDIGMKLVGY